MRLPVPFPVLYEGSQDLSDGYLVPLTSFCAKKWDSKDAKCLAHYQNVYGAAALGPFLCPYGFTTYKVGLAEGAAAITGVVGAPRFGAPLERERAKQFPVARVSRGAIIDQADAMIAMDVELQRLEEGARRRIPQALHELRKLNAIVKQGAEKLVGTHQSSDAEKVAGAAQLMSNVFEVVEALTNIEDVSIAVAQKIEFIAVFDLAYKAKKIYQVRAELRPIGIVVEGDDRIGVRGSKKYFPLVLQILLDNAIKYGRKGSQIKIHIEREGSSCVLSVSNKTDHDFDAVACFERGKRFAGAGTDGDGLGLYLAREVVRAHGGTIRAELSGEVARFVVNVPASIEERR